MHHHSTKDRSFYSTHDHLLADAFETIKNNTRVAVVLDGPKNNLQFELARELLKRPQVACDGHYWRGYGQVASFNTRDPLWRSVFPMEKDKAVVKNVKLPLNYFRENGIMTILLPVRELRRLKH